jgi:uncharacterized NAD-dependent epimerase/dehydratase family protein
MNFKIAVIDRGIDFSHPRLTNCKNSGIEIKGTGNSFEYKANYTDTSGHGTAIAGIIHKIVPAIEIVAVKLSPEDGVINELLLCEGIKWCLLQKEIKVINISLGVASSTPHPLLYELCNGAYSKEVYICASSYNMPGYECYPAHFSSVFGITSGYVKDKLNYGYIDNADINIIAKGTTQRLAWIDGGYRISSGNSFATACFSGILSRMILNYPDKSFIEMQQLIKENAQKDIKLMQYVQSADPVYMPKEMHNEEKGGELFSLKQKLSFISKIALFPVCEKEIGSVVNFRHLSPFQIIKYYDYPRSFNLFNNSHTLAVPITNRIIDADFKEFDTLVIGYFLDQMFDANILFGYELIEKAIQYNKNFIIWDVNVFRYIKKQLNLSKNRNYSGNIYMPLINKKIFNDIMYYRHMPNVSVPVILVVGTSNKQGKITTQLRLKEILTSDGYRVSHISTEPQGALLGADFVFPYGHKSTVEVNEDLWGKMISVVMKGVEKYNSPHLIISGTQGIFIPRSRSSSELSNEGMLSSLHYMSGVLPDGIICAINPQDPIEIIQNLLKTIDIFSTAKFLFFVMTPWLRNFKQDEKQNVIAIHRMLQDEEMVEKMLFFQSQLGFPVIDIMDRTNDEFILKTIENAFTKEDFEDKSI